MADDAGEAGPYSDHFKNYEDYELRDGRRNLALLTFEGMPEARPGSDSPSVRSPGGTAPKNANRFA